MRSMNVLVIEDEPAAREVLANVVRDAGYLVTTAENVSQAVASLATGQVEAALCDIQLPDGNGIDLLKRSRDSELDTAFVMLTAFGSMESAVEALRAGAEDYIVKPIRHAEVLHRLGQIAAMRGLREENRALRRAARGDKPVFAFDCPQMQQVARLVDKIACTDRTVLITGESGTGKNLIARAIHDQSARRDHPFCLVNCSAIPDQLLESELFGHAKGAFTSADRAKKGLFVEAELGTLFLDEIGELPLAMQAKLLNVIEDKEVRPLGSGQGRRVDTRIVAATNRDLRALVDEGRFREDLYFRLSLFQIRIPPLRERAEDIPALIEFFLRANQGGRGGKAALRFEPEAEATLLAYRWPGNVREVENVVARACILADGDTISVDVLPSELSLDSGAATESAVHGSTDSLHEQRRRFEMEVIRRAIEEAGGDRRAAARRLKISVSGLYAKLSEAANAFEESHESQHDRNPDEIHT